MQTKFFVKAEGPEDDKVFLAIKYAIKIAHEDKSIKRIVLYSYTKNNFAQVDKIFGEKNVDMMFKTAVSLRNVIVPFKCETKITYDKSKFSHDRTDIVVACHMDADELFVLDDHPMVKYTIGVPWIMKSTLPWIERWRASEILENGTVVESLAEAESAQLSLLDVALDNMDAQMLRTKSLLHPMDEEACKICIRAMHKYMPDVTPEEVENKLVTSLGWTSKNASEVGNLLRRLKEGRTFRGGAKTGLQTYFKDWKKRFEESKGKK